MDNSPLWDAALGAVDLATLPVPEYRRVDTDHAPSDERPTTDHYDRYMAILEQLRLADYQAEDPRMLPFRVADVLTNTAVAAADLHLATMQTELGSDPSSAHQRATALTEAMCDQMWDDDLGLFVDLDRCAGQPIPVRAAAGLLPLELPLPMSIVNRLLQTAHDHVVDGPHGPVVPSVAADDPSFEARRYWRGPVWANITWLLLEALRMRHADKLHGELRGGLLRMVDRAGCHEYFDPLTGDALGADRFSWTAALCLTLLD